jgi:hypothetical protein
MGISLWYDSDNDSYQGIHDPGLILATNSGNKAKPASATGKAWSIMNGNNKNGFGPNDRRHVTTVADPSRPGMKYIHMIMARESPSPGNNAGLPQSGGVWPYYGTRGGIYDTSGLTRNMMAEMILRCNIGLLSKTAFMMWPVNSTGALHYNEHDWWEAFRGSSGAQSAGKTTIWYVPVGGGTKQQGATTWGGMPGGIDETQWWMIRAARLDSGVRVWACAIDGSSYTLVYDSTTKAYNPALTGSTYLVDNVFSFALAQQKNSDIYASGVDKTGNFDIQRLRLSMITGNVQFSDLPTGGLGGTIPVVDQNVPTVPPNVIVLKRDNASGTISWKASNKDDGTSPGNSPLAGYRCQIAPAPGGVIGTYASVNSNVTIPALNYIKTGLTAATTYAMRVAAINANGKMSAYSAGGLFTTDATAPGTPPPNPVLIVTSADGTDSTANGPITEVTPATVLCDPSGSSGTYTTMSIDYSQDGGASVNIYAGGMPDGPQTVTLVNPGNYVITLTLTDGATGRSATDADNVIVIEDTVDESKTRFLGIPYPVLNADLSVAWVKQMMDQFDQLFATMALRIGLYNPGDDPALSVGNLTDDYPTIKITPQGIYFGDGSFDPLSTVPQTAPYTGTTTPPPPPNPNLAYENSNTLKSVAGGSSNPAVVLPTGITAGSWAVITIEARIADFVMATPSGWTKLFEGSHPNGFCHLAAFAKSVTTTDSGATVNFTQGSCQWVAQTYIAAACTGIDDSDIFIPSAQAAAQALNFPVLTTTKSNQLILGIGALRTSIHSSYFPSLPTSFNARQTDCTTSTTTNNAALTIGDIINPNPQVATNLGQVTSGTGSFLLAGAVAFLP